MSGAIAESRIPEGLQDVFLASNRGQVVHTPPPGRLASRVFTFARPRNWSWVLKGWKVTEAEAKAVAEEKTGETTTGTALPINDIYVPVPSPFPDKRGMGERLDLKRADSSTSSVTFQCIAMPLAVSKKAAKPKVSGRRPKFPSNIQWISWKLTVYLFLLLSAANTASLS